MYQFTSVIPNFYRKWIKVICVLLYLGWIIHRFTQDGRWHSVQQYHFNYMPIADSGIAHPDIDIFVVKSFTSQTSWERIPNLSQIHWPSNVTAAVPAGPRRLHPQQAELEPASFDPVMSIAQRNLYYTLLRIFSELMDRHGFTNRYFLAGGSLLGSHRHHDFIPWDEDIDILVDVSLRPWLREALSAMEPEYRLEFQARDKFFTVPLPVDQENETDVERSRQIPARKWAWPFLDISYYTLNETHVNEVASLFGRKYSWHRDVVFPLLYRPFGSQWYPAPRNPLQFLIDTYGRSDDCITNTYSHIIERRIESIKMKCHDLAARYYFVQHRPCLINGSVVQFGQTMLVEERLVRRLPGDHEDVIHAFCLAADERNALADTYGLDFVK